MEFEIVAQARFNGNFNRTNSAILHSLCKLHEGFILKRFQDFARNQTRIRVCHGYSFVFAKTEVSLAQSNQSKKSNS